AGGAVTYTLLDDGTAEISNFVCYEADYTIPSVIDGYTVTSIGRYAFYSINMLESVTIPDTVTLIDEWAFYRCKNLKTVKLGKGVKRIEYNAFGHCYSLTELKLNKGLEYVGWQSFFASGLVKVSIPKSLTYIDESAFGETDLTDVYYEGTKSQWNSIFIDYYNDELEEATIHYSSYFTAEELENINNFVERLYTKLLGRASDANGKAKWVEKLKNGATAADVAVGFVLSDELEQQKLSNKTFVTRMYQTMLNRTPADSEIANWASYIEAGCTYAFVFRGFLSAPEFAKLCASYGIETGTYAATENRDVNGKLTKFISRLYTKALNRTYDASGLNHHTGNYISGKYTLDKIASGFIFSAEFEKRNLSDENFVECMYNTFFDRASDTSGKANWLQKMANGMTREEVFNGFVASPEYKALVKSFGL
ncbi:MAG: DUF4214 domain-containing protein, partial [Ruminiclostridium sp.]|nr:DUF4214 domain-containing protein [Ruminiclostridium sp.]